MLVALATAMVLYQNATRSWKVTLMTLGKFIRNLCTTNKLALMELYKDPDTHNEMIIIAVCLPGGATNVEFSLVGGGQGTSTARITYSWARILFNIDEIFSKKMKAGLKNYHPKIMALKKGIRIVPRLY